MTNATAPRAGLIEVDDGWPVAVDVGSRLSVIVVVDEEEVGCLLFLDGQTVWRWVAPAGHA